MGKNIAHSVENDSTVLRFEKVGTFSRKGLPNSTRRIFTYDPVKKEISYDPEKEDIRCASKVYRVFHNDESLGVKIYSLEACIAYIIGFPKKVSLDEKMLISYERSVLASAAMNRNNSP